MEACAREANLQLVISYRYTNVYMHTHSHSPEPGVDDVYVPRAKWPRLTVYTA